MLPLSRLGTRDVRIQMRATTVSSADSRIRGMRLPPGFGFIGRLVFGFRGPRQPVLGSELSGVVVAAGDGVANFRSGDAVIAFPDARMGAHAEYVTMPEAGLIVLKPENLSFEIAAALCFGGMTAWDYLRKAKLQPGERLLVIGACGSVGSAFISLAKARGAHVTAVTSTEKIDQALALGADQAIDYMKQDFTTLGLHWDVVADTVAASRFDACLPILSEGGRYLIIAGSLAEMFTATKGSKRSIAGPAQARHDDLVELVRLAATGIYVPLIDNVYAFEDMAKAHARTDSGRKQGAVVLLAS
ncbi:NAD(P)-dependent alcohol dehydrogenase [Brevundimonas sp.]